MIVDERVVDDRNVDVDELPRSRVGRDVVDADENDAQDCKKYEREHDLHFSYRFVRWGWKMINENVWNGRCKYEN